MSWDYAYQAAPVGGLYEDLLDYCQSVRIVGEPMTSKRGSNPSVPYRDGEYSDPKKFFEGQLLALDVVLRYTGPLGTVTHPNGTAGHVHENLAALKNLLGWGRGEHVMLRRTSPHEGAVQARVEFLGPIQAAGPRMRYTFPMRMLDGVWEEQALQNDGATSISSFPHAFTIDTGGNYEIGDAKITFTCVADGNGPSLEQDIQNEIISAPGAFVALDEIVVDLGRDRAFTLNGTRYAPITSNRAWWMRLLPDTTGLDMTLDATSGTWTVDIDWRNKWL